MKEKIVASGLPIFWDEEKGTMEFEEGLLCDGASEKNAGQMSNLWKNADGAPADAPVYQAYRNIRFPEDEEVFHRYGLRYDITAIRPGTVNGEYKKTSGHFHGGRTQESLPYPEVYEVIRGEIVFILQRMDRFALQEDIELEEVWAVHAKAGQIVIIPPYYGHGSINPGKETSMFSNLAVTECPLYYDPVLKRNGLAAFLVEHNGEMKLEENPNYRGSAVPRLIEAKDSLCRELGIESPCYPDFIRNPEKYMFLPKPETSVAQLRVIS